MTNIDRPGGRTVLAQSLNEVEVEIEVSLLPAEYIFDVGVYHGSEIMDRVYCAFRFETLNTPVEGQEAWLWPDVRHYVRPASIWSDARQVDNSPLRIAADDITAQHSIEN